jgi:hypothetical protein
VTVTPAVAPQKGLRKIAAAERAREPDPRDSSHFNWIGASTVKPCTRIPFTADPVALAVSAQDGDDIMPEIVELKIDETKAVVGGARAALREGGGAIHKVIRFLEQVINPERMKTAQ